MNHGINKLLNTILILSLMASMPLAHAGFGPAATARDWCKRKTLHYLERHGYIPYNWEATTYIEGNNYITEGVWRIDVDELKVQCTTNKHARKSSGKYKILNGDIMDKTMPHKH
jgi:hypothetical protein